MDFLDIGAIWAIAAPLIGIPVIGLIMKAKEKNARRPEEEKAKRNEQRKRFGLKVAYFFNAILWIAIFAFAVHGFIEIREDRRTAEPTPHKMTQEEREEELQQLEEARKEEERREEEWDEIISEDDFSPLDLLDHAVAANSSSISWYSYSSQHEKLAISFHSNPDVAYIYSKVPPAVYKEFVSSDSLGSYYVQNIKGKYPSEKVEFS